MEGSLRTRLGLLGGVLVLALLWGHLTGSLLACLGDCYVDYLALRGEALGRMETADARLNSWILAWVQHALRDAPGTLFDANIFYPARNALAASEHLLGLAVPMLPLGAAGLGPVALHQVALVASFLLGAQDDLLDARNRRDDALRDLRVSVLQFLLDTGRLRVSPQGRWLAPGRAVAVDEDDGAPDHARLMKPPD